MSDFPQVYAKSSIIGNPGPPDARMVGLMQMIDNLKKQNEKLKNELGKSNKGKCCCERYCGPTHRFDECRCKFEAMFEYSITGSQAFDFYRILKEKMKEIRHLCRRPSGVRDWKEEIRNPIMDVIVDWDKQYNDWSVSKFG